MAANYSSVTSYSNASLNDTDDDDARLHLASIIAERISMTMYTIICIVGMVGNTLVIYVVLRFAKMKTVTNMYIMNLAIADEMYLIGLPFLVTTMVLKHWPFGFAMCKLYMITASVNQFTSSLFLAVMSSDRYLAVCHPVKSVKYRTPLHAKIVCACVWTISVLVMIPVIMYARTTGGGPTCTVLWPGGQLIKAEKAFVVYSLLLGFGIPVALTMTFYVMVLQRLKTVGPRKKSKEKKRSHRRVTKMVLVVITVYIFCWLPYWSLQLLLALASEMEVNSLYIALSTFVYALAYANSAVNPILYAFLSENFKKSFIKAFRCAAGNDSGFVVETSTFPGRGSKSRADSRRRKHGADSDDDDETESTHVTSMCHSRVHTDPKSMLLTDITNGQNHTTNNLEPDCNATAL
ncbi:PREDICTED: somatostatin receptor type 2-like [Priapulus caudatus]|uniref:Somatostatin receptor type 2-like n=1 Tax=Priapulus caudatus TaxID=37621 RepID=A0ABM1EU33_PRICU|nr:PREDICTED: somatostatin receptor type 2-like [Priapulus caudatus]XP_014675668.1 PREDICTED: somatostatin receptor type 2-like [Priapulus caudatus]XP_014675676.1 PREDICTED: somatostatin receptor type 2-like [Priapulus caudatus]XP_014675684.1 PREDICTED: somatostatin receptor type 2-like [Priapulus caudatus]XP_014675690.1 PREDICTED: somatostatin receptor type 2-like [Priapulus caudatus]XP_014675696.1 PREDICTED: somatostatin receptor type 2-like [Priapulus caudatus]XP_014675704.1 PREDICTED: som